MSANPYLGKEAEAIAYGKEVYHMVANCQTCHSGYATHPELVQWGKKYKQPVTELEDNLYRIKVRILTTVTELFHRIYHWHNVRSADTVDELISVLVQGLANFSASMEKHS